MLNGIILIGVPCSGKSEIGKRAAEILGIPYISSGDIARNLAKYDKTTKDNLDHGKMASEDLMRIKIDNAINNVQSGSFILDGFPRFKEQAEWLDRMINLNLKYVMVNVPLSQAIDRMQERGRTGDIVKERMTYYYGTTYVQLSDLIDYEINNDNEHTIEESVGKLVGYITKIGGKENVNDSKTR